ncbi:MAG TPA: TetR/AcrR family transcriptional regulator [Polyangiales bacterium]
MRSNPRNHPRQARSKATVETILQGAIRVLIKKGYEGTTTTAIAERAGVSVGSVYQYFPNKESIVARLVERHAHDIVACIEAAAEQVADARPEEALRAMIRAAIEAHRIHPALHKVLSEQVPRVGRMKTAMDTSKRITAIVAAYLVRHRHLLGHRDPQRTAFVIETVVEALTHRAVIERPEELDDGVIEAEAMELVMSYAFAPQRPPRAPVR